MAVDVHVPYTVSTGAPARFVLRVTRAIRPAAALHRAEPAAGGDRATVGRDTCPVTNRERSDARNSTTSALSSGEPTRPTGTQIGQRSPELLGHHGVVVDLHVWVTSGAIAFTRTPRRCDLERRGTG